MITRATGARIRRLALEGRSQESIARVAGISQSEVSRYLRQEGILRPRIKAGRSCRAGCRCSHCKRMREIDAIVETCSRCGLRGEHECLPDVDAWGSRRLGERRW